MIEIKEIQKDECKELYSHIKRDFSANERAPFHAVKHNFDKNIYSGYYLTENDITIGYAVITAPEDLKYALINYFAVMPEYRSKGYGSEFLKILLNRYSDRALVIEADDPAAIKNPEKHNEALRRVKFYERVGFHIMPTKKAKIFGAEYLIMSSGNDENLSAKEILHSLYLSAFKSKIWLKFIDVEDL